MFIFIEGDKKRKSMRISRKDLCACGCFAAWLFVALALALGLGIPLALERDNRVPKGCTLSRMQFSDSCNDTHHVCIVEGVVYSNRYHPCHAVHELPPMPAYRKLHDSGFSKKRRLDAKSGGRFK